MRDILAQMKKLMTDTVRAVFDKIDPHRKQSSFEARYL